jgi:Fe-S cluster biogenesis protein NfuA/nitrite reductase/ring-hydroxylating ferredoxin subunit
MAVVHESDPRQLVADVERLLDELEQMPEGVARGTATRLVQALLDLYGTGLERIVEEIALRDDGELAKALAEDELISHLLLLHGLHPVALEGRVLDALQEVRPYLESHGGNVELLSLEGTAVRLRLRGSCSGCPSSTMTLKLAIEKAVHKAAPEIEEVIAVDEEPAGSPLLQIEVTPAVGAASEPAGDWVMAGGLPDLGEGRVQLKRIAGREVLFLRIGGRPYAYLPHCPACGGSLEAARLERTELRCPACMHSYDALRAGRCLDEPQLHLEPVPLLEGDDGLARIALEVPA